MDRGPKRSSVRLLQRHWRLKRQCWLWPGKTTSTSIGVFGWRKRFADAPTAPPAAQLVPVMVTPDRADTPSPLPAAEVIEIERPSGHRIRIGSGVKAVSLRLVLDALERR